MLVCHCRCVSDREIRACVRNGSLSLREVCKASGAGQGCGGCVPLVKELVRDEATSAASAPSALGSRIAATGIYR
jgi:bacterioferritin-associated ferredoxin